MLDESPLLGGLGADCLLLRDKCCRVFDLELLARRRVGSQLLGAFLIVIQIAARSTLHSLRTMQVLT